MKCMALENRKNWALKITNKIIFSTQTRLEPNSTNNLVCFTPSFSQFLLAVQFLKKFKINLYEMVRDPYRGAIAILHFPSFPDVSAMLSFICIKFFLLATHFCNFLHFLFCLMNIDEEI